MPVDDPADPQAPPVGEDQADPGRVTLRRLSRRQYDRTVADLLGTSLRPGRAFPADAVSLGFDNLGDSLTVAPLHLEMYEQAADALTAELLERPADDPTRLRILSCAPAPGEERACATQILQDFASRAFRRPATDEEVETYVSLLDVAAETGEGFLGGIRMALTAVLMSPSFLFRVEVAPTGDGPVPLGDHEIATRLSYFLWSTMPDDELLEAANAGLLQDDEELLWQVDRMLADERAKAFVPDFAGQWLSVEALPSHDVDGPTFPSYDEPLMRAMQEEVLRFFAAVLEEDRPISELLTADFTFVNAKLATHYGLEPVEGWQRVSVTPEIQAGILGKASILTITSGSTRTSPVKRGKWVLEQLLCSPPPPPPPGVEGDLEGEEGEAPTTLRERLARHREDPVCASCHETLDPLGLGLENFDGIGAFRTVDELGLPIDSSGVLPSGEAFSGAGELAALISQDARFASCVTQQLVTYGVGRDFTGSTGQGWVDAITERTLAAGGTVRDAIEAVVLSEPFRMHSGEVTQ